MASRHLLNPLAPLHQPTPSQLDGVPEELERDLRACELLEFSYRLSQQLITFRNVQMVLCSFNKLA